jgi:hypothetical protein
MRAHEPETAVEDGSFDGSGPTGFENAEDADPMSDGILGADRNGAAQKSRAGPMPPPIMSVVSVPTGVVATPPIGAARIQRPAP